MGDCGEDYRAMKKRVKEAKGRNKDFAIKFMEASDISHTIDGNYSIICMKDGKKAIFYSTTRKWQYSGRTYYGGVKSFCDFVSGG